jgi:hypothetical protein
MTKVPFNQAGLDLKRQMLSQLTPFEFTEQMELIQHSTRIWYIDNFIFNIDQIEYINLMPQLLIDEIGLNSRIAIQYDTPFVLETPAEYVPPLDVARPRKAKTDVKGGGTYTPLTGELNYKFTFSFKLIFFF